MERHRNKQPGGGATVWGHVSQKLSVLHVLISLSRERFPGKELTGVELVFVGRPLSRTPLHLHQLPRPFADGDPGS